MAKVPVQKLRDMSEGIIQAVDESIIVPNSVYLAVNLLFHKNLGRAVLRDGTTQLGNQVVNDKSCLGLFQHIDTGGTEVPLVVFNIANDATASIYKYTGGAWSSAHTGLAANTKVHFATFLDTTVALNGSQVNTTTDGSSWGQGGNLDTANCPIGKYVLEFKDRVYTAGVAGNLDRLYYSSTPTDGAVSWTSGNGHIDVEPEEGTGAITGLAKVPGYVLIFKNRSLKRWDTQSTYPESMITIGCPSQEGIVQTMQSVFYYNKRGIYETIGGYPRKVSRRIQDIIDVIPSTYYSNVSGWGDGENVFFSIGDITLDDLNLTNCVIVYRINSKTWTLLSFPNEFKAWHHYVDSNGDEIILGADDDGNVWKVLTGSDDNGTDIDWLLQWNLQEFGSRGLLKDITKLVVYDKKVRNGRLTCQIDEKGSFKKVGSVSKDNQEILKDLRGRFFEFRLQGSGKTGAEIIGIDFVGLNINLSYE